MLTVCSRSTFTAFALMALMFLATTSASAAGDKQPDGRPEMSPMGRIARGLDPRPDLSILSGPAGASSVPQAAFGIQGNDVLVHSATAVDFQSETTIAVNGNNVVVGYNDVRGFALPAVSVSGYSFSSDGGVTWTDGGQLPTVGLNDQVFGDPDVKTWTDGSGNKFFYYASIYSTPTGDASLSVHVSTDGGATWSAPREVTTATSLSDFADKEFMDVDPETGRIFISWTNFGTSVTMRVTYSDDMGLTWNGPLSFTPAGQGSLPRADGASNFVHVAWRSGGSIIYIQSSDNGLTYSAPATIASGFSDTMNPYGSDRIHGFPSMAVNPNTGQVHIVFSARGVNAPDFSDIFYMRGDSFGASWGTPVVINAHVGDDRTQFFPWIAVEPLTGDISVVFYDQRLGSGSSDLTDVFHVHSFDKGATWSCPTPLTDQSFHAEAGNTTSQPNLGDYIQTTSENGQLYTVFAKTDRPTWLTFSPDTYVDVSPISPVDDLPVAFLGMNFTDTGCISGNGFWEPCERITLFTTIQRYCPSGASFTGLTGTLTTTHPLVTVINATQAFGNLPAANSSSANLAPFDVLLDPSIPCGDTIEFTLQIDSPSLGKVFLHFSQVVGKPLSTSLLSESFDGVSAPALPAGWLTTNSVGTLNPWGTSTTFASTGPNSVFCADIGTTSLNELSSPALVVPADCALLEVEFDITHNIELDTERKAWDGALLRLDIDGQVFLAGATASTFEPFYPWQMNRQNSTVQPLQDLSCWSSDVTPNFSHVRLQFPDLAGHTVKLLFDMSTDNFVGTATGMFVDNIVVRSIKYECVCTDPPALATAPTSVLFVSVPVNTTVCDTITIVNTGATTLNLTSISGCSTSPFSIDSSLTNWSIPKGGSTTLAVCVTPTVAGSDTCLITIASNDPNGPATIPVVLDIVTAIAGDVPPRFGAISVSPNPFNPETVIRFTLPARMAATVEVWSVTGQRVAVLAHERTFSMGANVVTWKGRNSHGDAVASGVYFVRLKTAVGVRIARAVLLK